MAFPYFSSKKPSPYSVLQIEDPIKQKQEIKDYFLRFFLTIKTSPLINLTHRKIVHYILKKCLQKLELNLTIQSEPQFISNLEYIKNEFPNLKNLNILWNKHFPKVNFYNLTKQIKLSPLILKLRLDFSGRQLSETEAKTLGKSIFQLKKLQSLQLYMSENNIGSQGLKHICDSISKLQNMTHLTLHLGNNKILSSGGEYLKNCLKTIRNLKYLDLYLTKNELKNEGISSLVQGISAAKYLKTVILFISSNSISDSGGEALKYSLENLQNLEKLSIQLFFNPIKARGAEALYNLQSLLQQPQKNNQQIQLDF